jgi:hypothetical protein
MRTPLLAFALLAGCGPQTVRLAQDQLDELKRSCRVPDELAPAEERAAPCAPDIASCALPGCVDANDPNHVLTNTLKRRAAAGPTIDAATLVTTDDLWALQLAVDHALGSASEGRHLSTAERGKLQNLPSSGAGPLGEGQLVKLAGHIIRATASTGESVNCNLTDEASNDFHINIVDWAWNDTFPDPEGEFYGAVVELIPQGRTVPLRNVRKVGQRRSEVLAVGPLFYDSAHYLRDAPDPTDCFAFRRGYASASKMNSQPRRTSLWEIHPVAAIYTCSAPPWADCDPNRASDWTLLK